MRVIGQKALVKAADFPVILGKTAAVSFFAEDTGWTKSVGKNARKR